MEDGVVGLVGGGGEPVAAIDEASGTLRAGAAAQTVRAARTLRPLQARGTRRTLRTRGEREWRSVEWQAAGWQNGTVGRINDVDEARCSGGKCRRRYATCGERAEQKVDFAEQAHSCARTDLREDEVAAGGSVPNLNGDGLRAAKRQARSGKDEGNLARCGRRRRSLRGRNRVAWVRVPGSICAVAPSGNANARLAIKANRNLIVHLLVSLAGRRSNSCPAETGSW